MKNNNIQEVVRFIITKRHNIYRLLFLTLLIYFVYVICFLVFPIWNEVPNHIIDAEISAMGIVSKKTHCTYRIRINSKGNNNEDSYNTVYIYHAIENNVDTFGFDKDFYPKFKNVLDSHKEIASMSSFYILDYNCQTTIRIKDNSSTNYQNYDSLLFCYIDAPSWDKMNNRIHGSGFASFPYFKLPPNKMGWMTSRLGFYFSVINYEPELLSPWDITQANYNIQFKCKHITCDTLSIESHGATIFSHMYPIPDKITMNSIEFTNPIALQEITKNGLQFHAEFLELKEMNSNRSFILAAILSAVVSFIVNILYGYFWNRKK